MKSFVNFFELRIGDVGVNLRGSNRRMSEHCLDAADVGAVHQEIGSKRMAKCMRVDIFNNTGFGGIIFYNSFIYAVFSSGIMILKRRES